MSAARRSRATRAAGSDVRVQREERGVAQKTRDQKMNPLRNQRGTTRAPGPPLEASATVVGLALLCSWPAVGGHA